MQASEQLRKELDPCYIEFYRCMIERDFISLSAILDDGFVLVHMTGMRHGKEDFIGTHAVMEKRSNSRKPERLKENIGAAEILLTEQEIAAIDGRLDHIELLVFGGHK